MTFNSFFGYICRMKNLDNLKSLFKISLIATIVGLAGCINDPSYNGGGYGYDDPYYDYDRNDYYRDRERDARRDRYENQRERERLENERRRLEEERRRERENQYRPPPPPPQRAPAQDRCPAGFSPSERKCTAQERKKGCRDIRTPGGLGCVSR